MTASNICDAHHREYDSNKQMKHDIAAAIEESNA